MYSGNIFIVEDDPLIALDIKNIIADNGYTIAGHTDTAEIALEIIPQCKPDIILMDINIKGNLDGIQVASALNEKYEFPIVFLTALSDEETLSRARLTKPFGYIVKPFEEADIVSTIEMAKSRIESTGFASNEDKIDIVQELLPSFENVDQQTTITHDQLSSIKIFSDLDRNTLENVIKSSYVKSFSAGDIITAQENKEFGFIVLGGRVGIVSTSIAGKDLINTLLGSGDVYGMFFVLEEFSEKVYAKAQSDSKVLIIPKNSIKNLLASSLEFNHALLEEVTKQLTKNILISQALAFSKVEGRIINALLALLPSFGKKVTSGDNAGRLFITRKELADFTGTTPETAIRVTKALERSGLLDLTKPGIIKILDIEALHLKSYE